MSAEDGKSLVLPPSVRWAGWLGLVEGLVGVVIGVLMVVRDIRGVEDEGAVISGWGTGLWFLVFGGIVAAAGWFLSRGRRWGRGPVVMLNMIFILVAVFMFSSGRPELAVPTALVGIFAFGCLFHKDAVDWAAWRHTH